VVRFQVEAIDFPLLQASRPVPSSLQWVPGTVYSGLRCRTVEQTTHYHLVPRLRLSGAILSRLHMASWRAQGRHYLHTNHFKFDFFRAMQDEIVLIKTATKAMQISWSNKFFVVLLGVIRFMFPLGQCLFCPGSSLAESRKQDFETIHDCFLRNTNARGHLVHLQKPWLLFTYPTEWSYWKHHSYDTDTACL
jgi:hypothetical protein